MSEASQKRRTEKRRSLYGLSGAALEQRTKEIRREQLRENPEVQALVGEALRNQSRAVMARLKQTDGMAAALGIMVARAGGRVVLSPVELAQATTWNMQFLPQKDGHLVMHVIRDDADMAAARLRERAQTSGLVLP